MEYIKSFKEHYSQLLYTFYTYPEAIRFSIKHKLWHGFWHYSWVGKLLLIGAVLMGLKFIHSVTDWFQHTDTSDPLAAMSSVGTLMVNVVSDEYDYLTNGSMRYLMIVLLEIVIFHVCRKTLEILIQKESDSSVKAFIHAQIRMIKVAFFCYGFEMFVGIIIKTFFGMVEVLEFLQPIFLFISSMFFMGFAVLDNYLEQFDMSIKESFKFSKHYIGVAIGVGLALNVLFHIPLVGPVIAPFLAAVTVTLAMYELSDIHLMDKKLAIQLEEYV